MSELLAQFLKETHEQEKHAEAVDQRVQDQEVPYGQLRLALSFTEPERPSDEGN